MIEDSFQLFNLMHAPAPEGSFHHILQKTSKENEDVNIATLELLLGSPVEEALKMLRQWRKTVSDEEMIEFTNYTLEREDPVQLDFTFHVEMPPTLDSGQYTMFDAEQYIMFEEYDE